MFGLDPSNLAGQAGMMNSPLAARAGGGLPPPAAPPPAPSGPTYGGTLTTPAAQNLARGQAQLGMPPGGYPQSGGMTGEGGGAMGGSAAITRAPSFMFPQGDGSTYGPGATGGWQRYTPQMMQQASLANALRGVGGSNRPYSGPRYTMQAPAARPLPQIHPVSSGVVRY